MSFNRVIKNHGPVYVEGDKDVSRHVSVFVLHRHLSSVSARAKKGTQGEWNICSHVSPTEGYSSARSHGYIPKNQSLTVRLSDSLELVLLLNGVAVSGVGAGADELVCKALGDGAR